MTTETSVQTLAEIKPGSVIDGRYTVEGELGAGGFATVFAAFDREIERQVAIKVLNLAAMGGGQNVDVQPFLERFRREARLAARIRHGNVVEIYDFGVLGTQSNPYMVMEMLDGYDLQDEIDDRGGMAPARALPLFCGALDALGEAHQLGIVHKDLKPANLFINRPGTRHEVLKVVDFGIAHIGESSESRMTQTGAMFGTPQYLPPEYIQTQVVTPGMDVYQMGLILVELLTGRAVVNEDNPWQCAVKHVTREIDIPVKLLDGTLGPILRRALEYEPEDRYADAGQFGDALSQVDPASIGDVRSPDTPYRKIDNTSGQFVPLARAGAVSGLQNTETMSAAAVAAQPPGLSSPSEMLKTPPGQLQTNSAAEDQTETLQYWANKDKVESNKKLWLILILLLFLVVGTGIVVAQSGMGSEEELGARELGGGTPDPIEEQGVAPTPGNALAVEPGKTPAQGLLPANAIDDRAGVVNPPGVVDDKTANTPEAIVAKPEPVAVPTQPKPKNPKPRDKKPADKKPVAKKPTPAPKPLSPPDAETPKPEEPAPKRPGMMLAPDLDPNDMGMDLAP